MGGNCKSIMVGQLVIDTHFSMYFFIIGIHLMFYKMIAEMSYLLLN